MSIKYIRQYDEKDCGPACLAMISQFYGKRVSIPRLREYAKTDKLGTNLYGLIQAGKKIGIELTGVQANSIDDLKESQFPIMAHIINQQGYNHYIIIEKIEEDTLYIVDPAKGKYKLSSHEFSKLWTKIAILIDKNEDFTTENESPSHLTIFVDIFKHNYRKILFITFISFLINIIGITGALYFKILTDNIIPSNILKNLHIISLGILVLYIINAFINYLRYQLILHLSLTIDVNLMKDYFYHVLHLPMNFFDTRKSGEILQRFMDTSKIREALSSSTLTLFVDTFMIIIGAILLYMQSPLLLLVTIVFIPLFIICSYSLRKPFEKYNQKVAENDAELSSYLIESFDGSNTIKSYQSEDDRFRVGTSKFNLMIENLLKLGRFSNIQLAVNNFLKLTISLVILWIGSYLVMTDRMTLGSLLAFNALTIYYLDPIERLINIQPTLQSSFVAARRISEITDLETESELYTTKKTYSFKRDIDIENVYFQYGFRNTVLKNINLNIKKGQKIAIVGESGSGKSTIGKLLNRYYVASNGKIMLDYLNINDIDLSDLRKNIGYISQDTFLFADTIKNNLLHGSNKNKSEDDIIEACRLAHALDFIQKLPDQFNTMLEKEGANLSGGQAQRLSLARTFLKDPDIYIFDEATSALDSLTENKIMHHIDLLLERGKTVIIISHKLSTIKNANKIYVLNDGEIVESGTHDTLIQLDGVYNTLWKLQMSID
ncbi:peptidase domain-containing ABC transporter [Streptococcus equi]|uniref:peptidase domain-containing ABC transporter n=2 Tax=Staphylococcus TaxID=1279 RepID=UPI0008A83EE5|nr:MULTISPECIES: peptidase domain-containing ABC transporter [unclassified Staphylococcus]NCA41664.1 peptidase domain-containing ABC transporter [Streptococcus equi]OHO94932.1 bacteriocin ABC transporter ATP-binding protein [Staphylococcus sp. HMSC057G10]OHQ39831.1 bacteriocin ABC transporter ATP-binding protein [Staphylococcus sp. HMSC069E07]